MANGTLVLKFPELDLVSRVLAPKFSQELEGAGEDLGSVLESFVVDIKGVVPVDLATLNSGGGGGGAREVNVGSGSGGADERTGGGGGGGLVLSYTMRSTSLVSPSTSLSSTTNRRLTARPC